MGSTRPDGNFNGLPQITSHLAVYIADRLDVGKVFYM